MVVNKMPLWPIKSKLCGRVIIMVDRWYMDNRGKVMEAATSAILQSFYVLHGESSREVSIFGRE